MSFTKFGMIRQRMPVCTKVSEKLSQGPLLYLLLIVLFVSSSDMAACYPPCWHFIAVCASAVKKKSWDLGTLLCASDWIP